MYTPDGLLEFCRRSHVSFGKIMDHCQSLTDDELNTKINGFGDATIKMQIHHTLGAQKYWIGVIEGRMDVDDDPDDSITLDELFKYRDEVVRSVEKYLKSATTEELITARPMITWGGTEKTLVPAHIVIRTLTHLHHHFGQIAAMCRAIGKPIARGMDYPILP